MKKQLILSSLFLINSLAYCNGCNYINKMAKNIMTNYHITGMSIAIVKKDSVEYCNYGYANKNKINLVTEKSIFEIASITKTFTAMLAAMATYKTKLNLKTPIAKYMPSLKSKKEYNKINMQILLSHISGLPLTFNRSYFNENNFIKLLVNFKFTHYPGRYYEYSNPGFALAGVVISKVFHRDYADLITFIITTPLEMEYTCNTIPTKHKKLVVTGYKVNGQPASLMKLGLDDPAGGLKSNTLDLSKYLRFQMSPHATKFKKVLAIVHKNYACLIKKGIYQQLGWELHSMEELSEKFLPDSEGRNIMAPHKLQKNCKKVSDGFVEKTGNSPGMTSYIGYLTNNKLGVAILCNQAKIPQIVDLGRFALKNSNN